MASFEFWGRRIGAGMGIAALVALLMLATPASASIKQAGSASAGGCPTSAPAGWVVLPGNIPPVMAEARLLHPTDGARQLSLSIGFRLRNEAELEELLREQNTPGSPNYHKYLTPAEFQARFGPTPEMVSQVENFLTSQHLRVIGAEGLLIQASGQVSQVNCAFATQLNDYQLGNRTVYAPAHDPAVPASIAPFVLTIAGLDDVAVPHPQGLPGVQH
jgi:hypothetical protein